MGWYFTTGATRASLIHEIVSEWGDKCITQKAIGNNLWCLIEGKHPTTGAPLKYIALYLLESDRGGWGYKPMDETCGPNEVNCPLSFLRVVEKYPPMAFAAKWRERVLAYHGATPATAEPQGVAS